MSDATIARFTRAARGKSGEDAVSIVAIINPISGAGTDPSAARRRIDAVSDEARRRRMPAEIHLTERVGHARLLASASAAAHVDLVIVWGGDGTVNEVGGALI